MESVERLVVTRRWGAEVMDRKNTKLFLSSKTTQYDTIIMDTCHCKFV